MSDLMFRSAVDLAASIRSGELTAREVVQESLDRIEALNPEINAFVDVFAEEALEEAGRVRAGDERPFAGVPIAIKNNRGIAGKRLTFASDLFGDFTASVDHNVTRRLRAAGFIVVGSTTLPEFGILPSTETRRFGPTRNPWDPTRTPGGSSGGSAAAVAAGMVPIAHANDGGGSTRIPAACCGLVGLKPQRGRISLAPEIGHAFLVQDGVLTRTVEDTARVLDVLAGYELGDMAWAPDPAEPFATTAAREPGRLRIALTSTSPLQDSPIDPDCIAALAATGELLASLGHEVEEVQAPWGEVDLAGLFTACFGPAVCVQAMLGGLIAGREPAEEDMEPLSWALWQTCKGIDSVSSLAAEFQLHGVARAQIAWMSQWDAVVTPSLAEPAVPIGTIDPMRTDNPMVSTFGRSALFTPWTALCNVSGQPAVSLPLHEHANGMPLGMHVIGRPAGEGDLLALSRQVEAAVNGFTRRAPQPSAAA